MAPTRPLSGRHPEKPTEEVRVKRPIALSALVLLVAACSGSAASSAGPSSTAPSAAPSAAPSTSAAPATPGASPAPTPLPDDLVAWVIYQGSDGLRLVTPDGGTFRKALPDGPGESRHPDWSPDGSRITFVVDATDGTRDTWVANWDGSNAKVLVDCQAPCRDADNPAWAPDGTRIAFDRIDNVNGHNPGSKIQVVDVATGAITTLLATKGAEYAVGPRWSPDGKSLVVVVDRYIDDGNDTTQLTGETIAVVDLTASKPVLRTLRPFDTYSNYPDWHPTQDLILFAAGNVDPLDPKLPPENLFTIRPDGNGLTQITHLAGTDDGLWMSAFRPDGSGILATFVDRPSGSLSLASLGLDGSGLRDLGDHGPTFGAHSRQRPVPALP